MYNPVVTSFILRGPEPTMDYLRDCGIRATLDLEGTALGDGEPLQEALECERYGIRVWPSPFGAALPPSVARLRDCAAFLKRQDMMAIPTYVHCKKGVDRTGMVCASYRILYQGWTPARAARECFRQGMHWVYIPWLIQLWRIK